MSFLAPALLAGFVAIAIPLVLHLVQRERKRAVSFPSLMFLRKIPYQSVRRRVIRHWPLLLLRALVFALFVLAFARPFLPGARLGAVAGGGREVVILLDHSASMAYGDHWARARAAARNAVQAMAPGDRATVGVFASDVELDIRSTADPAPLVAAIDRAVPGSGATRYAPALRAAAAVLAASTLPRREIVLISDFQRSGWQGGQDARLPAGVTLTTVSVAEDGAANLATVGITTERDVAAGRERVTATARIVNHGAARVENREVTLEVDGRRIDAPRVTIDPGVTADVAFTPFPLTGQRVRAVARLAAGDPLPGDDAFRAVIAPGGRMPILVLEPVNPAPDTSLFLLRALDVGDAPAFEPRLMRADRVTPADIAAARVVILNDTPPPGGAAGSALAAGVRRGTGLFLVLGEHSAWPPGSPDLLPGRLGDVVDRAGAHGGLIGYIDYSHPVFEVFSAPRSGDLTAVRVFRYRQLAVTTGVIARFDDGAVAVAERRVGQGRVIAWTSTLDRSWNDLALKPVFVPFLHQAMKCLGRYADVRPWYTVGDLVDPASLMAPAAAGQATETGVLAFGPGGRRVGGSGEDVPFALGEQGFYEFRSATRASEPVTVAVNLDPAESDLSPLDPAELRAAVTGAVTPDRAEAATREETIAEQERHQALWWYFLAAGLLLLVIELAVANRLPKIA